MDEEESTEHANACRAAEPPKANNRWNVTRRDTDSSALRNKPILEACQTVNSRLYGFFHWHVF